MADPNKQEPHISCNACNYGIDLALSNPSTGSIKMVQWSWDEVREFVEEHGIDVTSKMSGLLRDHISK